MKKLSCLLSAVFVFCTLTFPALAAEPQNNATADPAYGTLIDYKATVHEDGSITEERTYATPSVQPMSDTVSGSTTVTKVFTETSSGGTLFFVYNLKATFTFDESRGTVTVSNYSGNFTQKDKATYSTPSVTSSGSGTYSASVKFSFIRTTQFGMSSSYNGTLSCNSAGVVS